MTVDELLAVAHVFRYLPRGGPVRLSDRPDVVLWPDSYTWARRTLPSTSQVPFVDWHPLMGQGRSRVSLSDGSMSYGMPML